MKRRGFVKLCTSSVAAMAASPKLFASGQTTYHKYNQVQLVHEDTGEPIRARDIAPGVPYLFHYPYVSTPCFLVDLTEPVKRDITLQTGDGQSYRWPGGCGPKTSIVSFAAICSHQMTHPAKSVSFINYREEPVEFRNSEKQVEQRSKVIYCCSEKSVFDPTNGCQVLGGPAPQPLTTIDVEYDRANDSFFAKGTLGGEMYAQYFDKFRDRLVLEHGRLDIDKAVESSARLVKVSEYSQTLISCSV